MTEFEYTCFRLEHLELNLPPYNMLVESSQKQLPAMTCEELHARRVAVLLGRDDTTRNAIRTVRVISNISRWNKDVWDSWWIAAPPSSRRQPYDPSGI